MAASVTQQMWDDMISHADQFWATLPDRDGHFRAMKDEIKTIDNVLNHADKQSTTRKVKLDVMEKVGCEIQHTC